jgi:hypothetical protein
MPSYLRRRGHTWFFRWKWPRRLAACGFPSELIRSLKTADVRIARRRALTVFLRIEALTSSNKMPSRVELEGLVRGWIDACVWRQEIHRAATGGIEYFDPHEIEQMGEGDARELDGLFRYGADRFAAGEKVAISAVGSPGMRRSNDIVRSSKLRRARSACPSTLPRSVRAHDSAGLRHAVRRAAEIVTAIPRVPAAPEKKAAQPASFSFTLFWDDFERHKLAMREWKDDTAANARGSVNIFNRIFPGASVKRSFRRI